MLSQQELSDRFEIQDLVYRYAWRSGDRGKALEAARAHCRGRLWCVFGCGGNTGRLQTIDHEARLNIIVCVKSIFDPETAARELSRRGCPGGACPPCTAGSRCWSQPTT